MIDVVGELRIFQTLSICLQRRAYSHLFSLYVHRRECPEAYLRDATWMNSIPEVLRVWLFLFLYEGTLRYLIQSKCGTC